MDLWEKQTGSEQVFSGRVLKLFVDSVALSDGSASKREIVRAGEVGCVLPVDETGNAYLVEQFRYSLGRTVLEAPAGRLNEGETPLDCAVRELKEETGLSADCFIPLGIYRPSPGILDETIHLFAAVGLHSGQAAPDEGEFVRLVVMPLQELIDQILSGKIEDGKTQVAVLKALHVLKEEKG
ncbi:MAG: NUDIX hydrolase [Clostridia bacterium]|nr:NUDIX hydrolase [Clostridia bacterium]